MIDHEQCVSHYLCALLAELVGEIKASLQNDTKMYETDFAPSVGLEV